MSNKLKMACLTAVATVAFASAQKKPISEQHAGTIVELAATDSNRSMMQMVVEDAAGKKDTLVIEFVDNKGLALDGSGRKVKGDEAICMPSKSATTMTYLVNLKKKFYLGNMIMKSSETEVNKPAVALPARIRKDNPKTFTRNNVVLKFDNLQ